MMIASLRNSEKPRTGTSRNKRHARFTTALMEEETADWIQLGWINAVITSVTGNTREMFPEEYRIALISAVTEQRPTEVELAVANACGIPVAEVVANRDKLDETIKQTNQEITDNVKNLRERQRKDSVIRRWIEIITGVGEPPSTTEKNRGKDFKLQNDLLYKTLTRGAETELLLYAPRKMRLELMRNAHDHPLSGHFAGKKVWEKIRKYYFWPHMQHEITHYTEGCQRCQMQSGMPGQAAQGYVGRTQVGGIGEICAIDALGPMDKTKRGNTGVLVYSCLLSKFVITQAVPAQTAKAAADFMLEKVIYGRGAPKVLVSD